MWATGTDTRPKCTRAYNMAFNMVYGRRRKTIRLWMFKLKSCTKNPRRQHIGPENVPNVHPKETFCQRSTPCRSSVRNGSEPVLRYIGNMVTANPPWCCLTDNSACSFKHPRGQVAVGSSPSILSVLSGTFPVYNFHALLAGWERSTVRGATYKGYQLCHSRKPFETEVRTHPVRTTNPTPAQNSHNHPLKHLQRTC